MSGRGLPIGVLARWLAWGMFWCGVYYAGVEVQTWAFSKDAGPKPVAADWLGPLHFWAPAALFFVPVWWTESLFRWAQAPQVVIPLTRLLAAVWSLAVAGLVVWVEDRLRPGDGTRPSTWVLVCTVAALAILRFVALGPDGAPALPPSRLASDQDSALSLISFLLLFGLVVATWSHILIGLLVLAVRRRRQARA